MSPEDNTQQSPAAPNMRGRWRRPAARTTGQPAPKQPASFGAVEDIQNVKETLSGSNVDSKTEAPAAETAPVESAEASAPSAPVLVCCLEKETANGEAVSPASEQAPAPAAEEPAPACGCGCTCHQESESAPEAIPEAAPAETPAEPAALPAAETPASEAKPAEAPAAEPVDEAALLKTDWREERKRYVGLRPDPVDRHPERVRSRPYEERAERGPRPERSERPERRERSEQRPPRSERLNTEVASAPRMSEYAPSRDRSERSASSRQTAKPVEKQGLISKVLRFFGIGKPEEKPAQRSTQGQGERPAFRGPRSERGERYGNRSYRGERSNRGDREGRDGRDNRDGDNRSYRHSRRRRRPSGQGQGGDYRRSQGPQGDSNA